MFGAILQQYINGLGTTLNMFWNAMNVEFDTENKIWHYLRYIWAKPLELEWLGSAPAFVRLNFLAGLGSSFCEIEAFGSARLEEFLNLNFGLGSAWSSLKLSFGLQLQVLKDENFEIFEPIRLWTVVSKPMHINILYTCNIIKIILLCYFNFQFQYKTNCHQKKNIWKFRIFSPGWSNNSEYIINIFQIIFF